MADKLSEIFSDMDQAGSPGATCAVVRDGEVIETVSVGEASIEHAIKNRRDTVFYIASTSKQFVACSIALLEAEGALSLDDDIRDYVPELHDFDEVIRVHHLVHHTSGIKDKYALAIIGGLPEEMYATDEGTYRLLGGQRTLNFSPGSKHLYSNSGYFLLAQIVERVGGESLEEFTKKRIFEPAGMNSTVFRSDPGMIIPNKASGYTRGQDGAWRLAEYTWRSLGAGGIFSTVDDLARWDAALYGGILEPSDLTQRLLRTRPLTDESPNNYAFGLVVGNHRGLPIVSHAGGVAGYSAEFLRYPEQRLTFICLANTSAAASALRARRVAQLYLSKQMEPETSAGPMSAPSPSTDVEFDADEFRGFYISTDQASIVEIKVVDGTISASTGGQTYALRSTARDRAVAEVGFEVTFDNSGFTLSAPGSADSRRFIRVTPAAPDDDVEGVAGRYRSDELAQELEIRQVDGSWEIARDAETPRPLRYLGKDLFQWTVEAQSTSFDLPITVIRGADNKPNALSISGDRALQVLFRRTD